MRDLKKSSQAAYTELKSMLVSSLYANRSVVCLLSINELTFIVSVMYYDYELFIALDNFSKTIVAFFKWSTLNQALHAFTEICS